jgi:hypothetical protein
VGTVPLTGDDAVRLDGYFERIELTVLADGHKLVRVAGGMGV